jgi:hypothetical protein
VGDSPRQGLDPLRVKGPLQFFSLVAYVVSLAFLYAGIRVLSVESQEIAWILIIGALLLTIGITAGIFITMPKYHWTYFHPSEITEKYASAVKALSDTGKLPPEVVKEDIQQEAAFDIVANIVSDMTRRSELNMRGILMEVLDRLAETSLASSVDYPNLTGKWKGIVNGRDQIIEIRQHGQMVFLEGTVLSDTGTVVYTFKGEGRVVLNILAFSWQIKSTSGTNIMTMSPKGNVLEGKYFTLFGASGYERYERTDEKQSENS